MFELSRFEHFLRMFMIHTLRLIITLIIFFGVFVVFTFYNFLTTIFHSNRTFSPPHGLLRTFLSSLSSHSKSKAILWVWKRQKCYWQNIYTSYFPYFYFGINVRHRRFYRTFGTCCGLLNEFWVLEGLLSDISCSW